MAWEGQEVGGMALDCLRGLVVSEREGAGTTGLGATPEGVDLSPGLVFCLRREGLKEKEAEAERRPGDEVR